MTKICPNCGEKVAMSGSVLVALNKCWSCSNWYFCGCGAEGQLRVGEGRMHGREKMVWKAAPEDGPTLPTQLVGEIKPR